MIEEGTRWSGLSFFNGACGTCAGRWRPNKLQKKKKNSVCTVNGKAIVSTGAPRAFPPFGAPYGAGRLPGSGGGARCWTFSLSPLTLPPDSSAQLSAMAGSLYLMSFLEASRRQLLTTLQRRPSLRKRTSAKTAKTAKRSGFDRLQRLFPLVHRLVRAQYYRRLLICGSLSLPDSVVTAGVHLYSTCVKYLICCIFGLCLFVSRRDLKGQQGLE